MNNNRPSFEHTVNVLVQAYLNDELEHKSCTACACGNIIANAFNTKPAIGDSISVRYSNPKFANGEISYWFYALDCYRHNLINQDRRREQLGKDQINHTGYTLEEIDRIEVAFESAEGQPKYELLSQEVTLDPQWMFNGLMAVVSVLAEIHGVSIDEKKQAEMLFAK